MAVSLFDVIGPVMVGPSSSHTAGAVRLGNIARRICQTQPRRVEFYLHGSFARTYLGHGTGKALVCDPVAGLVEVPCSKRNATGTVNALICAEMALAGIESVIPFDEIVDAMFRVGRMMSPDLRETARGGCALTPTAQTISRNILSAL